MLAHLSVKNFAVIESASIDFSEGLNVISGETGAGKSLLITALKLLTGDRFMREMIRDENSITYVEGLFYIDSKNYIEAINKLNLEDPTMDSSILKSFMNQQQEVEILIRREIDLKGRSKVIINGKIATVSELKSLNYLLADIHGQNEHQKLLKPSMHLSLLDGFVDIQLQEKYSLEYSKYRDLEHKRVSLLEAARLFDQEQEILRYRHQEIVTLQPTAEDEELSKKIKILNEKEKMLTSLNILLEVVDEGEANLRSLSAVALSEAENLNNMLQTTQSEEISEEMQSIVESINSISQAISTLAQFDTGIDMDLDKLHERQNQINNLQKKLNVSSISELLEQFDSINSRLEQAKNSNDELEKTEKALEEQLHICESLAENLNKKRYEAADLLKEKVESCLQELDFQEATFDTIFETVELNSRAGLDAEFFICLNRGFDSVPLARTASGGETARLMLAIKDAMADVDNIGISVFDEIDTGISGQTSKKVASKFKRLAKSRQVIVISHQPVVVSAADAHFHIAKSDVGSEKIATSILPVANQESDEIIAEMIAGSIDNTSIQQAKELKSIWT